MHDRLMSYILGASHLINLLFASLMKDSGISLSDLENIAGTTFAKQLEVSKAVVSENQDLYFDIQCNNQESRRLFQNLQRSIEQFQQAIESKQRDQFKNLMTQAKHYFS
jgi:chorismate mutase / prephenate dehydrogenase